MKYTTELFHLKSVFEKLASDLLLIDAIDVLYLPIRQWDASIMVSGWIPRENKVSILLIQRLVLSSDARNDWITTTKTFCLC